MILTMAWPATKPSTGEDPSVFEGLRRRDPQAMAKLYDSFGRIVYSLIYRIVQDAGVAEDLVQETFLRVWNQAHSIDPARGSPAAWLLTVARNRAIDWTRSAAGKADCTVWEDYEAERPGNFLDMEKVLIDSDQARRVRQAVEKLNEKQRSVIELAYFEGLSQSEMAARMGQPLGTVKTWIRSALRTLREDLSVAS
jgi:RNA polymerase sigma-70 factor (ECF subfamily)